MVIQDFYWCSDYLLRNCFLLVVIHFISVFIFYACLLIVIEFFCHILFVLICLRFVQLAVKQDPSVMSENSATCKYQIPSHKAIVSCFINRCPIIITASLQETGESQLKDYVFHGKFHEVEIGLINKNVASRPGANEK